VLPCHPTEAGPRSGGSIHGQFSPSDIGRSGPERDWRRGRGGAAPKGDERDEIGRAFRGVWGAIGLAERDKGQVLNCCVDDQCFVRGIGILDV
jgi:hypothetical protein